MTIYKNGSQYPSSNYFLAYQGIVLGSNLQQSFSIPLTHTNGDIFEIYVENTGGTASVAAPSVQFAYKTYQ